MLQTIQCPILVFKPPIPSTPLNTIPKLHADTHKISNLSPKRLKMWAQKLSKGIYIYTHIYTFPTAFTWKNRLKNCRQIFITFFTRNKQKMLNLAHFGSDLAYETGTVGTVFQETEAEPDRRNLFFMTLQLSRSVFHPRIKMTSFCPAAYGQHLTGTCKYGMEIQ